MENQDLYRKLVFKETPSGLCLSNVREDYKDAIEELCIPESWGVVLVGKAIDCDRRRESQHAFEGMKALRKVSLPSTVRMIGPSSFCKCLNLEEVTLGEGIESIGYSFLQDTKIREEALKRDGEFYLGPYLIEVKNGRKGTYEVREGTTLIAGSAFGHQNITKLILPSSLRYIGDYAFYDCWELASIDLPDGILGVGEDAFYLGNPWRDGTQVNNMGERVYGLDRDKDGKLRLKGKVYMSQKALQKAVSELRGKAIEVAYETTSSYEPDDDIYIDENSGKERKEDHVEQFALYFDYFFSHYAVYEGKILGIVIEISDGDEVTPHFFAFDGSVSETTYTGYSASRSSRYLRIHRILLIDADEGLDPNHHLSLSLSSKQSNPY